jgi:translation initiation factor 5
LIFFLIIDIIFFYILAAMLNIPSTVDDTKYRYKMPKMQVKIESKGNGIKTNIVNLGDVAKHLRTNEQYILKWFGF